jgi:hypothetical protein
MHMCGVWCVHSKAFAAFYRPAHHVHTSCRRLIIQLPSDESADCAAIKVTRASSDVTLAASQVHLMLMSCASDINLRECCAFQLLLHTFVGFNSYRTHKYLNQYLKQEYMKLYKKTSIVFFYYYYWHWYLCFIGTDLPENILFEREEWDYFPRGCSKESTNLTNNKNFSKLLSLNFFLVGQEIL